MRVLADQPLLDVLCRILPGQPSTEEPSDWIEPLLVYAHSKSMGWPGGLARLERMLARTSESVSCRVAIIGFLPDDSYDKYSYLLTSRNYSRLPLSASELPRYQWDYQTMPEEIRSKAQEQYIDFDLFKISHDLRYISMNSSTPDNIIATLRAIQPQLNSQNARHFLDGMINEIARTNPMDIPEALNRHREYLATVRGRYEPTRVSRPH